MKILSGKEVRIKRIVHNISMKQLAEDLNISRTWLSLVENQKVKALPLRTRASIYFFNLEAGKE